MPGAHHVWERQRLDNERNRHDWEIAIAQTFQKHGYSRDESYRLARQHFELGPVRRGDNGGPAMDVAE